MDPVSIALCMVITTIEGNAGRAIATIAIIGLGIATLFGRVTWIQAILIATGIGVIFGALVIVALLTGGMLVCP